MTCTIIFQFFSFINKIIKKHTGSKNLPLKEEIVSIIQVLVSLLPALKAFFQKRAISEIKPSQAQELILSLNVIKPILEKRQIISCIGFSSPICFGILLFYIYKRDVHQDAVNLKNKELEISLLKTKDISNQNIEKTND